MQPDKKTPWFLTLPAVIVALLCAGPLALPLLWMSPEFKKWQQWTLTAFILILTAWLFIASVEMYRLLMDSLRNLQSAMQ